MVTKLFLTTISLSLTGSLGYIFLKVLVMVGGNRLNQSWCYHALVAISTLFILPISRLWSLFDVQSHIFSSIDSNGRVSDAVFMQASSTLSGGVESELLQQSPSLAVGEQMLQSVGVESCIDWNAVISNGASVWLLLTIVLVLWNIGQMLYYRYRFERMSIDTSIRLQQLAMDKGVCDGIRSRIQILVSAQIESPVLIGFFIPIILLPTEEIPDEDARLIFVHELTHFRRKDLCKKLLMNMIQCIHWFNPIIYLLNRDFVYWMETSCDEHVVSTLNNEQRKKYGYLLIDYAPTSRYVEPKLYVSFTSCRYKLKRRISIMLKSNKKTSSLLSLVLAVVLAVSCLATTAFAATDDAERNTNVSSEGLVVSVDDVALTARSVEQAGMLDVGVVQVYSVDEVSSSNEEKSPIDDTVIDTDVMPLASGELAAKSGYSYGSVSIGAGKTITINATYTPTDATMRIGYVNSSGIATYVNISGGSGSHTFTISTSGTYKIYIYNSSSYDVDYNISYLVN